MHILKHLSPNVQKNEGGEISLAPRCRQSVNLEAPSENGPASGQARIRTLRPAFGSRGFSPRYFSIPLAPFHSATLVGYERPSWL